MPTDSGPAGKKERMSRVRKSGSGAQPSRTPSWQSRKPDRRYPDPPSGELSNAHSLASTAIKALVEPPVFLFPISWADLNRIARGGAFIGQRLKLVHRFLVGLEKAFQISFDAYPLRIRFGAKFGFKR